MATKIRGRNWCFTLNNYEDEDYIKLKMIGDSQTQRFIIGKEIAPTTNTKHLQGYFAFKNQRYFEAIRKLEPKAHWEKAKGNHIQNWEYCSKGGDFVSNYNCKKESLKEYTEKFFDKCFCTGHLPLRNEFDLACNLVKYLKENGEDYKKQYNSLYDDKFEIIKNCNNCSNYINKDWEML